MTIQERTENAISNLIFGKLGRPADFVPEAGDGAPDIRIVFKPLGRQEADYGDGLYAVINVLRSVVADCPVAGDTFVLANETPSTWRVMDKEGGETDGQTPWTWAVTCVADDGKRLSPSRLERV